MPARPKTPHLFVVEDRGYRTPCHVWTRALNAGGYGIRKVGGVVMLSHRHAYETEVGPIPDGLTLDHLCGVTACVNAEHLEPVTSAVNTRRSRSARLTDELVLEIRASRGKSNIELAVEYGVSASWISRIRSGRSGNRYGRVDAWDLAA